MSQPVKLSDGLVLDARLAGKDTERSIAGQIEFWARLGRAIEPLLRGERALALKRSGDARPLHELVEDIETSVGRRRLDSYLATRPFPHFEQHGDDPTVLVKIDEDGTRTVGRFVNRTFVALDDA